MISRREVLAGVLSGTALRAQLSARWSELLTPPERIPLSEWAEKHLYLSADYARKTGPIKLFGWQREIFDSFTDPEVRRTVLMCGTQLVKTLFIQASLAYVIAQEPGPVLLIQPKEDDAQAFSKERLAPMVRDCPILQGKVADVKGRDTSNTVLYKRFGKGGSISLVGANAPGNLARRSIRYLFGDETDKYPSSSGTEGDPLALAEERTVTYQSLCKIIYACSPTIKGKSRIGKAYGESDQRKPWVPCSKCGEFQLLEWSRVRWDNGLPIDRRPATAHYLCVHCNAQWDDVQRKRACDKAIWRAEKPFMGTAGFWVSHLYSPWKSMAEIVQKFLVSKDDRQRFKTFVNTNLAELWEEAGETPIPDVLMGRTEDYPFNEEAVVPWHALFLTCGVDVQPDRLEYEVVGWGRGKESWSIEYGTIRLNDANGDAISSSDMRLWAELDKVLARDWKHESGSAMPIMAMCIDTGDRPKPVYEFARRHASAAYSPSWGLRVVAPRTVVPIKGYAKETLKLIAAISGEDAARKRGGVRIVSIGTTVAKQELYDNLRVPRPKPGSAAPGYCHFPKYEIDYFNGLCSEKRVTHDDGSVSFEKIGGSRNEPLDTRVYARGGAALFGLDTFVEKQWRRLEVMLRIDPESLSERAGQGEQIIEPAREIPAVAVTPTRKPRRSVSCSFLNS